MITRRTAISGMVGVAGLAGLIALSGCSRDMVLETSAVRLQSDAWPVENVQDARLEADPGDGPHGSIVGTITLKTKEPDASRTALQGIYGSMVEHLRGSKETLAMTLKFTTKDSAGAVLSPTLIGLPEQPTGQQVVDTMMNSLTN